MKLIENPVQWYPNVTQHTIELSKEYKLQELIDRIAAKLNPGYGCIEIRHRGLYCDISRYDNGEITLTPIDGIANAKVLNVNAKQRHDKPGDRIDFTVNIER